MENNKTENNLPSQAVQNAAKTAILMAVLLLCSKLFGFIRETVMAAFYGTSYIVDAYVMAQAIPTMLFAGIFTSLAIAYMPLLSEKMEQGSQKEGNLFTSRMIHILIAFSVVSSLIGLIFSDQLTAFFAKGFTGRTAFLTSSYLKISFSYIIFSSVAGILEYYLQYKGTFIPQIIVGYVQNGILIAVIVISAHTNCIILIYGLFFGNMIRMILMYFLARKREFNHILHPGNYSSVLKQIMPLAIPVFIGSCGTQINVFVDKYLASDLAEGSIAALNYGNLLNTTIMTLSTSILSTIIFPKISQSNASGNRESVISISRVGVTLTILISLPFALGAIVYCNEIVQIVFERGAFDAAATSLTKGAYRYYAIGMTFMALTTLLTNVYYSLTDTRKPMIFSLAGVAVNVVVNLLLVDSMQHEGLALGTSCAAIANACLLYAGLRKNHGINVILEWGKIIRIAIASSISVGVSFLSYKGLVATIWMPRMVYLGIAVCIAIAIYISLLKFFKIEELRFLTFLLKRRKAE